MNRETVFKGVKVQMGFRGIVRNAFLRLGYDVRTRSAAEAQEQQLADLRNRLRVLGPLEEYTYYHANHCKVYYPCFEPWFQQKVQGIRGLTVVSDDRLYVLSWLATHALGLPGDFAECGVFKGGSAKLVAEQVASRMMGKQFHLFDTFDGMPEASTTEGIDHHKPGDFATTSLDAVSRLLRPYPFVAFHPGLIPGTLASVADRSFCYVYIDVDQYQSILDCCEFFYPRMVPGGFMVFDDYGFEWMKGARRAVDEFFADQDCKPLALPNAQALVIK